MIEKSNLKACTGCGVCASACPSQCISLDADNEGFVYPNIDTERCVGCNKCVELCHLNNIVPHEEYKAQAFVGYNVDDAERFASSSGGIFIMLAKEIIASGGKVYGAATDENLRVVHIGVDNYEELKALQGSKYVQSYITPEIYKNIKKNLDSGIFVLFSGTPCQVAALNSFLKVGYDNLLTVSFICHGVPSPAVWSKYIEWQKEKNNSSVKSVSFRNKKKGWSNYSMNLLFDNGKCYNKTHTYDPYLRVFLSDTCLRPSCYECMYKGTDGMAGADIVLADNWGGLGLKELSLADNKGVSLFFTQSEKGRYAIEKVAESMRYAEVDFSNAISTNPSYSVSSKQRGSRERFFSDLNSLPFKEVYKKHGKIPTFEIIKRKAFSITYKVLSFVGVAKLVRYLKSRFKR